MIPNAQPILDYWFPSGSVPPQAFTIDTNDQIQILPDWLKLKMIRSPVDRLVDAALIDLTPDQIVLFVQNFGTPVNSMSKLLALLDRAVIEQFETVKLAIMNKTFFAQLIEIQQTRGAKNGHIAVQALELHGQILPDPPKRDVTVIESIDIDLDTSADIVQPLSRTKQIEDIIDVIFSPEPLSKANNLQFRKLMQQLIAKDLPNKRVSLKQQTLYGSSTQMQQFVSGKVLQYLQRLVTGQHGIYFFQTLLQKSSVCCLFRTLLALPPENIEGLGFLVQVVDQCIQALNHKLNPVLFQMLLNKRKMFIKPTDDSGSKIVKQDFIQVLQTSKTMELEKSGKKLLNELFKQTDSGYLVDAITAALKVTENEKIQNEKIGLLVDWLANIDSELVVSTRDHQLDLLFSRSVQQFRFYLLSLLSHQASWTTLHSTLKKLLHEYNANYDPSSVLHFIEALIRNPKLWQGRDKATPKHEQIEYVINMNSKQIQVFTDYILSENNLDAQKLNIRIQIFLKCVSPERLNLKKLINYIVQHSADESIKRPFLQQLYLNVPPMKLVVANLDDVYSADGKQLTNCEADIIANYTLTAISSLSASKENQIMSADMELMLRKLASTHPALMLRQLSVIGSLLQGRAHMDLHVLRNKSMPLFNQVLGILELLQPQVFDEPYKAALHQALDCFFTLLKHHGRAKDTYSLMYRFMELLQAYTNHNANRALNFIEQYAELMQYLANGNRNIIPLQQLVQGVSLLKHRHTHDFSNVERSENISEDQQQPITLQSTSTSASTVTAQDADSTGAAAVILAPFSKQNLTPHHWPDLVKQVLRRNGDEIVAAIQEIESITNKRQGLLEPLFERLLELLQSPAASIRVTAHILLIRHLKYNPGNPHTNLRALTAYVQCLRDPNPVIVASALDVLTEMVICLQEFASEILKTVFNLGIQSKQNTFEQLRRCILALKTQHAC